MNTKKILAVGTLLLSCSLFVVAQNAVASDQSDQVDLRSTPCQCLMYKGINPQTSNNAVTPGSMASPTEATEFNSDEGVSNKAATPRVFPLRNDDAHSGDISYSQIVPVR